MGPKCNHKCPYEREAEGDLTTEEEREKKMSKSDGSDWIDSDVQY